MVRSIWRRTVLGVLASAGLALGQQAAVPSAPVADTVGRVITVTEMGKPGQKCKILREWKMADGSTARQVEDINTGEKLTIVETGVLSTSVGGQSGGVVKSVASRIFHWGKSETAPAGTPMPPPETEAPALVAKPVAPERKSAEPVVAPPKQTVTQNTAPASPYASSRTSGGSEKNTAGLPAPATSQAKDSTQTGYAMTRPVWNQATSASPNTEITQAPAQPAQPSDWRRSWGRLPERAKTDDTAKTTAKSDPTPKTKTDPLIDPKPYTKVAVEEKISEKMNLPKVNEKPASVAKAMPDPLPSLPPLPPLDKPAPMPAAPVAPPMPMPTPPPAVRVETTPVAPVVTAPAASRHSLRHEKVTTSAMPTPEPVGRVMIQNTEDPMIAMNAMNTQHLLRILHESIYPSQREWAADQLADCDWKQNAPIVDALVTCAKEDPAATVRAGCVRCLSRMHVNTVPVVMAVQSLKTDADPRVRTEVMEALATLAPGLPMQADPAIQPTKGE